MALHIESCSAEFERAVFFYGPFRLITFCNDKELQLLNSHEPAVLLILCVFCLFSVVRLWTVDGRHDNYD